MCYSALIKAEYSAYRDHGGELNLAEFEAMYGYRFESKLKFGREFDRWFAEPKTEAAFNIQDLISRFNTEELRQWEQELFKQRKRYADAERSLAAKVTRKAETDLRVSSNKIEQLRNRIEESKRSDQSPAARIYPQHYAPVLIEVEGKRQIVPMRYGCRPAGKPAWYDSKFAGTYNARRDNLEGFWKEQFGVTHGIVLISAFYENVERDGANAVLKFVPQGGGVMLAACLWSRWTKPGERDLLSFAAITDEPPAEVAAAGHDRCIIPIKSENVGAWLKGGEPATMYRILDDRERPYYEHQLAA